MQPAQPIYIERGDELIHMMEAQGILPSPVDDDELVDPKDVIYFLEDGTLLFTHPDTFTVDHIASDPETGVQTLLQRWVLVDGVFFPQEV